MKEEPKKAIIDRRDFLQKSIYVVGGMVGASWLLSACAKSGSSPSTSSTPSNVNFTIDISTSQYNSLQTNGNYVYANNIIIARDSNGNFIALSDVCTHQGCTIQFNGTSQFPCPCHGSIFDENGKVLQGPASSPVKKYTTSLVGNKLTVTG